MSFSKCFCVTYRKNKLLYRYSFLCTCTFYMNHNSPFFFLRSFWHLKFLSSSTGLHRSPLNGYRKITKQMCSEEDHGVTELKDKRLFSAKRLLMTHLQLRPKPDLIEDILVLQINRWDRNKLPGWTFEFFSSAGQRNTVSQLFFFFIIVQISLTRRRSKIINFYT